MKGIFINCILVECIGTMKIIRSYQFFLLLIGIHIIPLAAQDHHDRYEDIDILNYHFEINLADSVDLIRGETQMNILFKKEVDRFYLDLTNRDDKGVGMVIQEVLENANFIHRNDRVVITISPS